MADNSQQIASLKRVLASGARSVTVDGVSTTYASRKEILAEIDRLEREDDVNDYGVSSVRRPVKSINLGGF